MGVETYAMHGVNAAEYRGLLVEALSCCPDLIIDDGGDLLDLLSGDYAHLGKNLLGGAEETTTGHPPPARPRPRRGAALPDDERQRCEVQALL